LADEAHLLVQAHPREALGLAERALALASTEHDVEAEVAARYALGWAQYELGDPVAARHTLRAGIRLAERHGDRHGAGVLRRHLAFQLVNAGQPRAARREISAAIDLLTGIERARSEVHMIEIHRLSHDTDPAVHRRVLANAARALRVLHARGDDIWEARLLHNRGVLHLDRLELDRAEADLRRARSLYTAAGGTTAATEVSAMLAAIALFRGEIVQCLEMLNQIEAALPSGSLSTSAAACRYLALMQARLLPEALRAAEEFVTLFRRAGRASFAAAAELDVALIKLRLGDSAGAERLAAHATRSFAAQGKPVDAALARSARLRARLASGEASRSSLASALEVAGSLEQAGWHLDALRARLLAARVALATGFRRTAERELAGADGLRRRGTVADRVELCTIRARLQLTRRDRSGAERSLAQGLDLLETHRAGLGSLELRVAASGMADELTELGVGIALDSGSAAKVLDWSERQRANSLRLPPVRPPSDPTLRRLQTELRLLSVEARAALRSDRPARDSAVRQSELEARIREYTRRSRGDGPSRDGGELDVRLLGDDAAIEYLELHGELFAVTIDHGQLGLHELDPLGPLLDELEWLRSALRRLASTRTPADTRAAAIDTAEAAARALDRALVEPLIPVVGERSSLVIVPPASLHAVPWAALPSLRGRPVTVSPSLSMRLDLERRPRSRRRKTVLVSGPHLRHADPEVRELAKLRPGATVLRGDKATARATLKALDGAALAHLACHGRFRADSPLFSSLELADGPLNVYELQQIRRAPEVVILSACDLAVSGVQAGNEILGLAGALLGMGTRTIVASTVAASDAAAYRLMVDFHKRLLEGLSPAAALALAQTRSPERGFVCLGDG
jgi:CHAT domain-containing protein